MTSRLIGAIAMVALTFMAGRAQATTISIDLTSSFSESTTVLTTGFFGGLNGPAAPALPADATFTNPFVRTLLDRTGKFWRINFNLPSGFSNLTFLTDIVVNDEVALYLNDQVIAVQDDTTAANFSEPTPEFILNADGTLTDNSNPGPCLSSSSPNCLGNGGPIGWDFININQSLFQVGANEFTILGFDTCCQSGIAGSLAFLNTQITFDEPNTREIPAPPALALLAIGLIGLGTLRRRRTF